MLPAAPPSAADIAAASGRIAGKIVTTPLLRSAQLDEATGGRVFLKAECLQRTGSFKFRGALNALLQIPKERRSAGVVTFSSGNHAQGVALSARIAGTPAAIVMPSDAPASKRERVRALGAEIIDFDRVREDREALMYAVAASRGCTIVPPYEHSHVIAGQGTIGLEMVRQAVPLRPLGLISQLVVDGLKKAGVPQ
jgi:threonine dehydratase